MSPATTPPEQARTRSAWEVASTAYCRAMIVGRSVPQAGGGLILGRFVFVRFGVLVRIL